MSERCWCRTSSCLAIIWSAAKKFPVLPFVEFSDSSKVSWSPLRAMHCLPQKRIASLIVFTMCRFLSMFFLLSSSKRLSMFSCGFSIESQNAADEIITSRWLFFIWCCLAFSSSLWNAVNGLFMNIPKFCLSVIGIIIEQWIQYAPSICNLSSILPWIGADNCEGIEMGRYTRLVVWSGCSRERIFDHLRVPSLW